MTPIRADSPYNSSVVVNSAPVEPIKARPLSAERRSPIQVAQTAQKLYEALRTTEEKARPLTR